MSSRLKITLIGAGLLLTACSSKDALYSHLSSLKTSTAQVDLGVLYNNDWSEFAIVCPYAPSDYAMEKLDVDNTPWSDNWPDEHANHLLLKSDTGENKWVQYSRAKIDLCSPRSKIDLLLIPIATKLEFTFNHVSDGWILE